MANERTALGWQRSALNLAVVAALLLGHAVDRRAPVAIAASALLVAGAAWIGLTGRRLYRARRASAALGGTAPPLRAIALITLLAATVAVAEIVGSA